MEKNWVRVIVALAVILAVVAFVMYTGSSDTVEEGSAQVAGGSGQVGIEISEPTGIEDRGNGEEVLETP